MHDELLARAADGDEEAFRQVTTQHQSELQRHCYRILGSVQDAEDMVQESLLSAWRGLPTLDDGGSLRAWLYRIATNRCLDSLRSSRRRPPRTLEPPSAPPTPTRIGEVTWLQPYPDDLLETVPDSAPGPDAMHEAKETIELAFIAALQTLPPAQRSALVLREVLSFTTREVANMLDTTEDSVKGLLKRARATLATQLPERDAAPAAGSPAERELVQRFADAFTADDVDALVALLTDDAWLTMPPSPLQYHGPDPIAAMLRMVADWRPDQPARLIPTRANTQPAFGVYRADPHAPVSHATGMIVLTLDGEQISAIDYFLDSSLLARFGLPSTLPK